MIERTFRIFKKRWRVFARPLEYPLPVQIKLVYALVAVHNFLIIYSLSNMEDEALERAEDLITDLEDEEDNKIPR